MAERVNLYKSIHKAIRVALGGLVAQAGRTDFGDPREAGRLRLMIVETFELLDAHAEHEDRVVGPLLRACAPEAAARIGDAHRELEQTAAALRRMFEVACQAGAEVAREGHAFTVQLSRYQAMQLSHMADEEEIAQPALYRAYGDETLFDAQRLIIGSIAKETLLLQLGLILPSINAPERAQMLTGLRAGPPGLFAAVMDVARDSLDAEDLARLQDDVGRLAAA